MPELALHVPQRPRSLLRSRSAAAGRVIPAPAAVPALAPVPALALVPVPALAPVPAKAAVAAPNGSNGAHGTNGKSGAAHEAKVAKASVEDWLRIPEEKRAELIHGQIVYHAFPGVKHGDAQAQVSHFLRPYRGRRAPGGGAGGSSPAQLGGWWISQEVDLFLAGVGCRPDVVGWRRDRHARVPQPNAQGVITERPDFVCEVLSPSTARYDQCDKLDAYLDAGVPHYWIVDPETSLLMVLERTERGYLIARVAGPGELVRAAPFEGVEIPVEELFLDEEGELSDDDPTPSSDAPTSDQKKASPAGARKKAPSSSPPSAPATGVKKKASRRSG